MSLSLWLDSIAVRAAKYLFRKSQEGGNGGFILPNSGIRTSSGVSVTPENALKCAAVIACVQVLSQDMAKLPVKVYKKIRRKGKIAKQPIEDHPVYKLLRKPNAWQTGYFYRNTTGVHVVIRGNAYSLKRYGPDGSVQELIPIPPNSVVPYETPQGELFYQVSVSSNFLREKLDGLPPLIPSEFIMHERGMSLDGIRGVSPITYCKETVGLSLAAEEYGARVFSSGGVPSGILTYPGELEEETIQRIRNRWNEQHSGLGKAYRIAILEEGMKYEKISMTGEDIQYLQTRQFQIPEICRMMRVPPQKIFDLTKTTLTNQEHMAQQYVADSLMPWLEAREATYERDLLLSEEFDDIIIEHDVTRLLRGDSRARGELYAKGRQWGFLSANDCRDFENMPPIENGDIYLQPLNMVPAGTEPKSKSLKGVSHETEKSTA